MGRQSTRANKNIYQICREECELTREKASEMMTGVSASRIEKIEYNLQDPTPYDIVQMADCYKRPDLCNYYCSHKCEIGYRYVPEIEMSELSSIILETIASLDEINPLTGRLIQIARDGKITDDEIKDFAFISHKLDKVSVAIDALNLWVNKTASENNINIDMLNIEKENAVSAEKLKSAFIANMSHEIRTPLNAIVGFSGLLASADDDTEKKMYLDIVAENNDRLLQIVTDVLDLSKIESGSLDFHYSEFDVNDLLCGLHGILNIRLKDKPEIKLNCEAGTDEWIIYSEQHRIVQIITNLVHNAMKFTHSGEICFGCRPQGEDEIYFYVSDTGIGIPAGEQDKIFDRFTKLDHEVPGTGLGLTLSQTIVQNLGGEMGVESEVTKGSTFWFTLPLKS